MDESGVYNSTTISYENPNGNVSMSGGGGGRRPWNLSEMVSPPVNRSRWFHWMLLMGGSITLGLGLIVVVIGIYNQHYYNPQNVKIKEDEPAPSHWIITLMGCALVGLGLILLAVYCRLVNTNRLFCNPLARTRSALRQVVTKPRFQNGQAGRGASLLSNDGGPMATQYNPVQDISFRQTNGDVTSEEKAKLMAHEVKEGMSTRSKSPLKTVKTHFQPPNLRNPFVESEDDQRYSPPPPTPPQRPPRQKSSLRRDIDPYPSHYKARHFAGHGYERAAPPIIPSVVNVHKAPLASQEDISPSLRSSFASVMMYPPSDWGNSDVDDDDVFNSLDNVSLDSNVFLNLPPAKTDEDRAKDRELCDESYDDDDDDNGGSSERERVLDRELCKSFGDSTSERKFGSFRVSPKRHGRKNSLSSLSVQSAFS